MSNVDYFFIYDFDNAKLSVLSTDDLVEAMDTRNLHVESDSVAIARCNGKPCATKPVWRAG